VRRAYNHFSAMFCFGCREKLWIGSSARESDRRTGSHWCINNGSLNEHWFANNNNSEKNSGDTVQNYELFLCT
jgi:hypothetical protein